MYHRLIIRPEARLEMAQAAAWYERQRPGLGEEFLQSFLDACKLLQENPEQFQRFDGEFRRVLLKVFPYKVVYFVRDDEIIIIACAHAHRRPGYWRQRKEE
jgi:plasmid stabilization system protein ParE